MLSSNIRVADTSLIHSYNDVEVEIIMKVTLKNYGDVYFDPNVIANILSLSIVKERHIFTYASENGSLIVVHTLNNIFQQNTIGIHYHDVKERAITLVNKVIKVKNMLRISMAMKKITMEAHDIVFYPSIAYFKHSVNLYTIKICHVVEKHIKIAKHMF